MPNTIVRNLLSGLRLVLPVRIGSGCFHARVASISLGMLLSLAAMATLDYLHQEAQVTFSDFGALAIGSILFFMVFISLMIARLHSELERLPALLTAVFSAMPWFVLAAYAYRNLDSASPSYQAGWIVILGWGFACIGRAIRVTFSRRVRGAAFLVALSAVLAVYVFQHRYLPTSLFYSYDQTEYEQYADLDTEEVFYRQPELVASKVAQLSAERPGVVDTYFVGYAGNGEQSIFAREVRFAMGVVEKQFDAAERAISFVNDIESLHSEALANRHNLHAALDAVGKIMNPDEDVLFLFLTSHGSRDATIDTSLYPLMLQDLSAAELRRYLDDAGIRWRIIVISACYSGSFADELRDERTVFISAASKNRNSFGCSDERDLTYFGEEFFANQLSNNSNLSEAFSAAAENLRIKERTQGLKPSEPQILIGSLIRDKLQGHIR